MKKEFKLGDRLRIKDTTSFLDGHVGTNLGKSTEHIIDFYIVLLDVPTNTHRAVTFPESCLELVETSSKNSDYDPEDWGTIPDYYKK